MLEDPQPKQCFVCAMFAQNKDKMLCLCLLYSHNYFEQEVKNAIFSAQFTGTYVSRSYVLARTWKKWPCYAPDKLVKGQRLTLNATTSWNRWIALSLSVDSCNLVKPTINYPVIQVPEITTGLRMSFYNSLNTCITHHIWQSVKFKSYVRDKEQI